MQNEEEKILKIQKVTQKFRRIAKENNREMFRKTKRNLQLWIATATIADLKLSVRIYFNSESHLYPLQLSICKLNVFPFKFHKIVYISFNIMIHLFVKSIG